MDEDMPLDAVVHIPDQGGHGLTFDDAMQQIEQRLTLLGHTLDDIAKAGERLTMLLRQSLQ